MKYSIEPIFIVFPAICLLVSILNKQKSTKVDWILGTGFVLIYSFSLNGADMESYKQLYDALGRGYSVFFIHGEPGFNLIMKACATLGMDYYIFRILLLVITTSVLFLCMHKVSGDFALSLLLVSSMFLIYTISTYRQFVVMAFSIFWMIQYVAGRKWLSIIGTALLMLFHMAAVMPLSFLLIYHFVSERDREAAAGYICRNFNFLLIFSLMLRVFNYFLLKTNILSDLITAVLKRRIDLTPGLITAGFISRVAFLVLVTYIYHLKKPKNDLHRMLYLFFAAGMFLYIIVPLEYVMGRLMNNAYILSAVLIPSLISEPFCLPAHAEELIPGKEKNVKFAALGLVLVAFAVLISQLTKQIGYYPYGNILLQWIAG